uniref:RNA polymerase sigma-54 factor n=1 Tax=Desulfobacca acetoxidans TaxID=60893 RepID=A0A7V4LC65_9BACT
MALEIRQNLRLTQTLIMTQKLQQAIKLLQLSRLELLGEIHQALETNPVLEETQTEERVLEGPEAEVLTPTFEASPAEETPQAENGEDKSPLDDMDWQSFLQDQEAYVPAGEYEEKETPPYENLNAQKITLKMHLMWQLKMAGLDELGERIGTFLIGNLDPFGYLQVTLEDVAGELGVSPAQVEEVLLVIQGFDPTGVAARNLAECLLLQLRARGLDTPLLVNIISEHLQNLANKNYQAIARDLKVSVDQIFQAAEVISSLDPKPGRGFDVEEPAYLNPDVSVQKVGDDYVVTLNEDGLPKLKISNFYLEALRNPEKLTESARAYIQKHLDSALWFIRSIHQRQRTLYRVAESIVRFQKDFLDHGLSHLKPLTLRQVAEDVQMHESTISRVTTSKYMHTPQGVLEMKYFFNSGLNLALGDQIASESVKEKIRQIVQSENPENPLSDQEIAEILRKDNVIIARRTVAKYRGMLGVLSSSKRKKPGIRPKPLPNPSTS